MKSSVSSPVKIEDKRRKRQKSTEKNSLYGPKEAKGIFISQETYKRLQGHENYNASQLAERILQLWLNNSRFFAELAELIHKLGAIQEKPPYTPQIDHRHVDNVKEYVQKVCEATDMPEKVVITDLVLTGMEVKPLSDNQ